LCEADSGHAGQCCKTSLELAIERIDRSGFVADQRGIDAEEKNVVGIETWIHGTKIL
jgi:hypothetical protein